MIDLSREDALTEAELDRLTAFLEAGENPEAMNLEELDGFFAALIAGPELVPPSEYLPEIFGWDMSSTSAFETLDQARDVFGLDHAALEWHRVDAKQGRRSLAPAA